MRSFLPLTDSLLPYALVAIVLILAFDYPLSTFLFHGYFPYDQKRILEILLLLSAPLLLILVPFYYQTILRLIASMRVSTKTALLVFLCLGLVSSIFAKIPMAAFLQWSLYSLIIFFSLFWFSVGVRLGNSFFYYNSLLISIVMISYLCCVIKVSISSISHQGVLNFFPYFINRRFFSQFAIWTLALLPLSEMWCAKYKYTKYLKVLFILSSALWWALVIANDSRGLIYAFLISTVCSVVIFRKNALLWLLRQATYILLGLIVFFLLKHAMMSALHVTANTDPSRILAVPMNSFAPRMILYKIAASAILSHPWLGLGPMHYAYAPWPLMIQTGEFAAHPHNAALLILTEWGIPAGLALFFFVGRLFFNFSICIYRANNRLPVNALKDSLENGGMVRTAYFASLLSGLIYSMVSGVIVMPLSQLMLAIIVGSCLVLYIQEKGFELRPVENGVRRCLYHAALAIVIVFSSFILSTSLASLPKLTQSELIWLRNRDFKVSFNPGFWMQGWLTDKENASRSGSR